MFEDEEINQPDDINISGAEIPANEPEIPADKAPEPEETAPEPEISIPELDEEPGNNSYDADETVTVQPVEFASFEDLNHVQGTPNKNLDILLDVKLQLTVELGRTE